MSGEGCRLEKVLDSELVFLLIGERGSHEGILFVRTIGFIFLHVFVHFNKL